MSYATKGDVEKMLGCPMSGAETSALGLMQDGFESDLDAATGRTFGVQTGATLTFRPSEPTCTFRLTSPLADVTEVTVDGAGVTVESFATDGTVVLSACVDAGALVVATFDAGEDVPAFIRLFVAGRLAAAIRASRTAAAVTSANPAGLTGKNIGSVSATWAAPSVEMAEHIATAGQRFMTLTDEERRQLRRRYKGSASTTRLVA